jgi:hypothetical protein
MRVLRVGDVCMARWVCSEPEPSLMKIAPRSDGRALK